MGSGTGGRLPDRPSDAPETGPPSSIRRVAAAIVGIGLLGFAGLLFLAQVQQGVGEGGAVALIAGFLLYLGVGWARARGIRERDGDIAVDDPEAQPTPMAEEARRLRASWLDPSPEAPHPSRRIGWLVVGIAALAVVLFVDLRTPDTLDVDPSDPGWGDVLVVISPFFALAAAFVVGLVVVLVAAFRLIGLTVRRAGRAMLLGLLGGPVAYFAVLMASAPLVGALGGAPQQRVLGFLTFLCPVICGIVVTLIAAVLALRPARSGQQGVRGWYPH